MFPTKKIVSIENCNEKPKFWSDDEKMNAWFAPFRSRDLNPLNYDNKLIFWKTNIDFFCEKTHKFCFTLAEVKTFFVRHGKMPNCLQLVFENLLREGNIQLLSEYENAVLNNTWTRVMNTFVGSPLMWSLKKVMSIVVNPDVQEINENAEYIHLSALKKQSEDLIKIITKNTKEGLLTYEKIRQILLNSTSEEVDLKIVKLMVHCLEQNGKACVVFENKYCNEHLIKFSKESLHLSSISDSEISVYVLQTKEKLLIEKIKSLESEKDTLRTNIKDLLRQKMKPIARSTLRKQKELEKRIDKLVNILENIQSLLYKVQDTESDFQILESLKLGTSTLKSSMKTGGLTSENVEFTMNEIAEVLDEHGEVQEILGQTIGSQFDDTDLESELAELLIDDAPSIPPEAPSPNREIRKSEVENDEALRKRQERDLSGVVPN